MPKADPLTTWSDGAVKTAIVDFVSAVSDPLGRAFVPPAERIAVFDNDGTLWCEQPAQVQVEFAMARAQELAKADPGLWQRQPFKAFLERDLRTIHAIGKKGVFEFAFAIHAGMSIKAFDKIARDWLSTARHPTLNRLHTDLVYLPQRQLLVYLRANGFKTFIVSGGGVDFMRAFAEDIYGIPPEQVIGSSVKLRFDTEGGRPELTKLNELGSFDDRDTKAENIGLHIGRCPILAFGNSDGDMAMMRYTLSGPGRRLALLLHHDDAAREAAYDREFRLSPLSEALDRVQEFGFTLVSMKNDWRTVYA
jgi:phosphoglycolate phosphatase-like HAD superfamily hydrolase